MGGKREITPEREMVVMGMEMQGGGRGNQEILHGELQQGRANGKKCDRGGSGKMARNGERIVEGKMEMMAVRRSGGSGGGTEACGGGDGGGGWTPSPAFLEQPLERDITPFFLQMVARVCGGVPSPLIEPIMGREGKGPT